VEAVVRHAALSRALELVRAELSVTATRQRALERRWAPLLSDAIARLEAALDELEREDGVRARWIHGRLGR
jgi:V/A-type H+-transporting ATPase subunit D